jgi:hypothetical protein
LGATYRWNLHRDRRSSRAGRISPR